MESRFVIKKIDEVATAPPYPEMLDHMPKKNDAKTNPEDSQGRAVDGSGQIAFKIC